VNDYLVEGYGTDHETLLGSESRLVDRIRESSEGDPFAELVAGDRDVLADTIEIDLPDRRARSSTIG